MNEGIKEALKTMYDMADNAEDCISFLQTALIYNSSKPLKDCGAKVNDIKKAETAITKKIAELAKDNPDLKQYVSVPAHLLRIGENIEKLSELMNKKIKDNILFSDKAVTEITFLLQRIVDVLRPTSDIILAKNTILGRYVQESEEGIVKRATEYATLHEERLIEGLCLPIASSIYINMLDSIKNIAWHAKEITAKLVGWMLPKAQ
ncbi:MAG: hypothetical protein M1147_10360 [Nitrospirae bacterium]|nr:hypothetical protein [Nitrospirota bacterium]MCL5978494.1 hypothetical protein [Nitrospirota bacterium]